MYLTVFGTFLINFGIFFILLVFFLLFWYGLKWTPLSLQLVGVQLDAVGLFLDLFNTWLQLHTNASLDSMCVILTVSAVTIIRLTFFSIKSLEQSVEISKNKCNMKCGASLLSLRHTARMKKWIFWLLWQTTKMWKGFQFILQRPSLSAQSSKTLTCPKPDT